MKKRWYWAALVVGLLVPAVVWASGGQGPSEIVVVADTRVLSSAIYHYFGDIYNTQIWHFAIWATFLTVAYGAFLGFLMDKLMGLTGLDLKHRKIVEH
jgi:hypothetical protein